MRCSAPQHPSYLLLTTYYLLLTTYYLLLTTYYLLLTTYYLLTTGGEIELPDTLVFDLPTLRKLAAYVASQGAGAIAGSATAVPRRQAGSSSAQAMLVGHSGHLPGGVISALGTHLMVECCADAVAEVPLQRWNTDALTSPMPGGPTPNSPPSPRTPHRLPPPLPLPPTSQLPPLEATQTHHLRRPQPPPLPPTPRTHPPPSPDTTPVQIRQW